MNKPTLKSNTFANRTNPSSIQSLQKIMPLLTQKENSHSIQLISFAKIVVIYSF